MAAPTRVEYNTALFPASDRVQIWQWTLTTADATGDGLALPAHSDKTIQAYGSFGGGTLTIQGGNHPTSTTWDTLTDQNDNNLARTAGFMELIAQDPFFIRPTLTGSAGASLTVVLCVKLA